jgi:hypothetical protein
MSEILKIANSWQLWVVCGILVAVVLTQVTLFLRLCRKEAVHIGYPQKNLKRAIGNGMVASIGPAVAGIVIMISMMSLVGGPITWQRLSVIGSAQSELMVADIAASVMGVGLGTESYTISALTLCFFLMAVTGCGWLIVTTVCTGSMDKVQRKLSGGDAAWLGLLSAGASIGLISYMGSQRLLAGFGPMVAVLTGFGVQFLIDKLLAPKFKWLKGYSMAIALVSGIVIASIVKPV